MFLHEFDYYQAESVADAIELLEAHPEGEILAGGHGLIPAMKAGDADPETVIDIGEIDELDGIEHAPDRSRVGSLTSYADVASACRLQNESPVLVEAARAIGDVQVRNAGTVGGNIACGIPESDLPGAVMAADATIHLETADGAREMSADDFLTESDETGEGAELVTAVEFPHDGNSTASAYAKMANQTGWPIVGVAIRLTVEGDRLISVRIAANGVVENPIRLSAVEESLTGSTLTADSIETASEQAGNDLDSVRDDQWASPDYRLHLLTVYTERAALTAGKRLGVL